MQESVQQPGDNVLVEDIDMYEQTQPEPCGFFADIESAQQQACSVLVALRVRPLLAREKIANARICVDVNSDENQVLIGTENRCFTFDRAFDLQQSQETVFKACVKNLVLGCFSGFNATVLAYGQTGSGKTYTMGSGYFNGIDSDDRGIIPRVIELIFEEQEKRKSKAEFIIKCSFLEIYNEELIDLLDSSPDKVIPLKKEINVREEKNGTISVYGLNEVRVYNAQDMAEQLENGSHARRTASTLMNEASSRSHGIFTISIEQHLLEDSIEPSQAVKASAKDEFTVAKFHFVDLAGSERTKKTGAVGKTLQEGININKSLLALGQVISALTEDTKKSGQFHIPYRDSKLTRILQDSLGGNSRTSMIACCSPAESNFDETLNTLKYAARARNIKNKPVINRDPATQQILALRQHVFDLQKEMSAWRKILISNNLQFSQQVELPSDQQLQTSSQQSKPKTSLSSTTADASVVIDLRKEVQKLQSENAQLSSKANQSNSDLQALQIDYYSVEQERDTLAVQVDTLTLQLKKLGKTPQLDTQGQLNLIQECRQKQRDLLQECSELKQQLQGLQTDNQHLIEQASRDFQLLSTKQMQIDELKRNQVVPPAMPKKSQSTQQLQRSVQSPQVDNGKWLSSELEQKINHFDDIRQRFILNLGDQMSNLIQSQSQAVLPQETTFANDQNDYDLVTIEEAQDIDQEMNEGCDVQDDDELDQSNAAAQMSQQQTHEQEQQVIQEQQNISHLDTQLVQKEQLLSQCKEAQLELQNSLLLEMKEQYHKRIEALQTQLLDLEQQKSVDLKQKLSAQQKSKLEEQFKQKQEQLQTQLSLLAKKDLETKQMQKKLHSFQSQVNNLETEMRQIKTAKVQMQKRVKEETDKINKQKQQQEREMQKLKQAMLKKDRENQELKVQKSKQEIFAKRKQEELASLQKRQKADQQKKQFATTQRQQLKNVNETHLRQWIRLNVTKMLEYTDLQSEKAAKQGLLHACQGDIMQTQQQHAANSIEIDRLEQVVPKTYQVQDQLQACWQQDQQLREQLETLDEQQRFINSQLLAQQRQMSELKPASMDSQVSEAVKSMEGARACINIFFQMVLEGQMGSKELQKQVQLKQSEIEQIEAKLEEWQQISDQNRKHFEKQLQDLDFQFKKREKVWFQVIVQKMGVDQGVVEDGDLDSLFRICFSADPNRQFDNLGIHKHAVSQLGRSAVESGKAPIQTPKSQIVQPNLNDARNARKKQKIAETSDAHEQPEQSTLAQKRKSIVKSTSRQNLKPAQTQPVQPTETQFQPPSLEETTQQSPWYQLAFKADAHKSAVFAIANQDHNLYSSASKSLKIWDIDTMATVSELTESGIVRSICISRIHKLLIAASEKSIVMWDLVSLSKVNQFQAPNEIKCLEMQEQRGLLFAGTKGTATTGALLMFDLRKQTSAPVDQKEYNQDVNALSSAQDSLYLASRLQISPFDLQLWQTMQPLPPSHTDMITSLVSLPHVLVSGGRDKHLKSYSYQTKMLVNSTLNAHTDHITCIKHCGFAEESSFYTGSKDGVVKEWNGELKCTYTFPGNPQSSVNQICKLDSAIYGRAFACANSDKSIRIWRHNPTFEPTSMQETDGQTLQKIPSQSQLGDSGGQGALGTLLNFKSKKKLLKTAGNNQ